MTVYLGAGGGGDTNAAILRALSDDEVSGLKYVLGAGYSKKDFAAKMGIASKEARECFYWLELIEASDFSKFPLSELKEENLRLIRILTSIVKTCQSHL